jgi:hypothetical protein
MICVRPIPTDPNAAFLAAPKGMADGPQEPAQSDQPLLDWIAGELAEGSGRVRSLERRKARRILEQAFAAIS